MGGDVLLMGAVAYDPKVVTIWDGFRRWFRDQGLPFDYVLYSNYERQVEELVAGRIDAAWNSPLAWIRAQRLAGAGGQRAIALAMRDTDRDLTSVVVVRSDAPIAEVADLEGRTVGVGTVDSPQATLLPLSHLRASGVTSTVRRFDVGVGLHGDHVGGERDAASALMAGEVDAACVIDANHLLFAQEGTLIPGATRVLTQTRAYDHCNMTVLDSRRSSDVVDHFRRLLLTMDYGDPDVRALLDLEGLKQWREGRASGYQLLETAVDESGFYDRKGAVTAADYRP
jgi:ABC-type phosphate/phosphonate transport system substrate-binding protein